MIGEEWVRAHTMIGSDALPWSQSSSITGNPVPTSRANSIVGTGSSKVGMGSPGIRFWDLGPHEVLHLPELLIHNKVIIGKYFTPYNDRFRHSCRLQTVLLQSYGCMGCLLGGWVGKTEIKKFRKILKKTIFSKNQLFPQKSSIFREMFEIFFWNYFSTRKKYFFSIGFFLKSISWSRRVISKRFQHDCDSLSTPWARKRETW